MIPNTRHVLSIVAPGEVALVEQPLPRPRAGEVLIRSHKTAIKHGTELTWFHAVGPFQTHRFDHEFRLFVPLTPEQQQALYPRPLGNTSVGTVVAVGENITGLILGERVYGWWPIADYQICAAKNLRPLGRLSDEQALCIDPTQFALGGVLDADIQPNETVLIVGSGAIALIAVQYAKNRGATVVVASAFRHGLQLARQFGADRVYDLAEESDVGLRIKQDYGGPHGRGVDAAIECSGKSARLALAARATRRGGRVVGVGFYADAETPCLGWEAFHNALSIHMSLPAFAYGNAVRTEPPLGPQHLQDRAIQDLIEGRVGVEGLISPVVPLAHACAAVRAIATRATDAVKLAVAYPA